MRRMYAEKIFVLASPRGEITVAVMTDRISGGVPK
jgi:hypothetical protein